MAFNIFERWPWTSFQNLNLDWLMKSVKEAVTKADEAAASVGQFDARITQNTNAIEQLGIDLETISSTARVAVNSDLEAYYRGAHITGTELLAKVRQHGDLPYVEYNDEVYMLDSISNAGDMRFSMAHTTSLDDVIIRHIMIPAQSYNAAYSITNVGTGGGSSDTFTVIITDRGAYADPQYIMDSTFDTIRSQMNAGRTPVFLIKISASGGDGYNACGNVVSTTSYIDVYDPLTSTIIGKWRIYPDNRISRFNVLVQLATLDNIVDMVNDGVSTNALLKTAQTLSAAEQAQVKQNIGITSGGGGLFVIPVTSTTDGGVTTYSTTATFAEIMENMPNLIVLYNNLYYTLSYSSTSAPDDWYRFIFTAQEPHPGELDTEWIYVVCENNSVTITAYSLDIIGLPAVSSADNGKFLRVVNGSWAADTVPSAETTSFGP